MTRSARPGVPATSSVVSPRSRHRAISAAQSPMRPCISTTGWQATWRAAAAVSWSSHNCSSRGSDASQASRTGHSTSSSSGGSAASPCASASAKLPAACSARDSMAAREASLSDR